MKTLGIETSCDETSAAIIEVGAYGNTPVRLLSNVVATSLNLHAKTGGIIPEIAAREQIKYIIPVIHEALEKADTKETDIDAIAVTVGPGLIGSLLVGVETAKTLALVWNKPLIPVNHLFGHIYANWIETSLSKGSAENNGIAFPALALIVSGGHTDLVLMKSHNDIQWISGTRDDAAGEAFDKIGRLLGFPYPAGPVMEQLAKKGNPKAFHFPRPLMYEKTLDFSFSGLKTAALREIQKIKTLNEQTIADLCRATQDAIIDVLVHKMLLAAEEHNVHSLLLSGGVAANQTLRETFEKVIEQKQLPYHLSVPPRSLCTDNAAMIATAGFFHNKQTPWQEITANPELYFD